MKKAEILLRECGEGYNKQKDFLMDLQQLKANYRNIETREKAIEAAIKAKMPQEFIDHLKTISDRYYQDALNF